MSNEKWLIFDCAEDLATVAVVVGGNLISSANSDGRKKHAASLLPMIDKCLLAANLKVRDLDKIFVGRGPGSFTGVRVGIATAKGLTAHYNIPTFGFNYSLLTLAAYLESFGQNCSVDSARVKVAKENESSRLAQEFALAQFAGRNEFFCRFCEIKGEGREWKILVVGERLVRIDELSDYAGQIIINKNIEIISELSNKRIILEPHSKYFAGLDFDVLADLENWLSEDLNALYYRLAQADE